jgi:hypothetical protein
MNLLVVLCGCGTWPVAVREEYRLRVFEGRVLRRIIAPKNVEIIRGGGKNCVMWIFIILRALQNIIAQLV